MKMPLNYLKQVLKTNFIFFAAFFSASLFAQLEMEIESKAAFLINLDNHCVLFEKNADEPLFPASTTKVATALYAIREVGDDFDVEIEADQDCIGSITAEAQQMMNYNHPPHWQIIGGTHMNLAKGTKTTLEDLLYGLMLVSANDAANVIAKYVSGSISGFTRELNEFVKSLGCEHTHFKNAHGLAYPGHVTTARDLALISKEAMKEPIFRELVSTTRHKNLHNMNKLLQRSSHYYYPHAIGIKTGSHSKAGYPLVSAATFEGRNLLLVLLGAPSEEVRYNETRQLFQKAFSEIKVKEVFFKAGKQPFKYLIPDLDKTLKTYLEKDIELEFYPAEKPHFKAKIYWHPPALPILKGDPVAHIVIYDDQNNSWGSYDLLASQKIKAPMKHKFGFYLVLIFAFVMGLLFINRLTIQRA